MCEQIKSEYGHATPLHNNLFDTTHTQSPPRTHGTVEPSRLGGASFFAAADTTRARISSSWCCRRCCCYWCCGCGGGGYLRGSTPLGRCGGRLRGGSTTLWSCCRCCLPLRAADPFEYDSQGSNGAVEVDLTPILDYRARLAGRILAIPATPAPAGAGGGAALESTETTARLRRLSGSVVVRYVGT